MDWKLEHHVAVVVNHVPLLDLEKHFVAVLMVNLFLDHEP